MRRLASLLWALCVLAAGCRPGASGGGSCSGHSAAPLQKGTLIVGTDFSYAPFAFQEGRAGELRGFDVEVTKEVGRRLGLKVRFVDQTFSGLLPGLLARKYDIVASALRNDGEARDQACLTTAYLAPGQAVVTNGKQAPQITGTDGLDGHPIGVLSGSAGADWAGEHFKGRASEIRTYRTVEDAFANLRAGMLAGVVVDLPIGLYRQRQDSVFRVVDRVDAGAAFVMAVHPERGGLRDAIDVRLAAMRADGAYDRIFERWFGEKPEEAK